MLKLFSGKEGRVNISDATDCGCATLSVDDQHMVAVPANRRNNGTNEIFRNYIVEPCPIFLVSIKPQDPF